MADVEKLSNVALQIITYAGDAKSNYLEALKHYKQGNVEKAKQLIAEAETSFIEAHRCHGKCLSDEMITLEPQVSLLLVHAEDQLMNAETVQLLVEELIEIYQSKVQVK